MESLGKIPLHFKPFPLMTDPSAPSANFEQPFQVMQVVDQPFSQAEDNRPNVYDYKGLSGGIAPISLMNLTAKEELR
jgi:hypothetical protein